MMCHRLEYPAPAEEEEVVRRALGLGLKKEGGGAVAKSAFDSIQNEPVCGIETLTAAMAAAQQVHVSEVFIKQCVELVNRTRNHAKVELGCSPRAGLALTSAARARAFLHGRDYAVPDDLFALAEDVLLHRMRLSYEALAEGLSAKGLLQEMLRAA
jgi:MoxR-like ATPase